MKYYSETLKKLFDNQEELTSAEKEYADRIAKEKADFEAAQKTTSKRKKELSDIVESTSKALDDAYTFYEAERTKAKDIIAEAQKRANDIIEKANDEAENIMAIAEKEVKNASTQKAKAISNFNKEFGPYKTVLTGDKALEEYNKLVRNFDNTIFKVWGDFWNKF